MYVCEREERKEGRKKEGRKKERKEGWKGENWLNLYFFFFFFFLFVNLKHCISFAKHQNESATGIHVLPAMQNLLSTPRRWLASFHLLSRSPSSAGFGVCRSTSASLKVFMLPGQAFAAFCCSPQIVVQREWGLLVPWHFSCSF